MTSLIRTPQVPAARLVPSIQDETASALLNSGLVAFLVVDSGNIIASSPTLRELLGATTPYQHIDGSPLASLVPEQDRQSVKDFCARLLQADAPAQLQCHLLDSAGSLLPVQLAGRAVAAGGTRQLVLVATDLTPWVGDGGSVRGALNAFDAITGFPNRALLMDRLKVALSAARRYRRRSALLRIELENLEPLLESLGAEAALEVQAAIAETLRNGVRDCDTVARLGTRQFAILLPEIGQREDAGISAARVVEAMDRLFGRNEPARRVSAAIGVVVFPADGSNPERLMGAAESALASALGSPGGAFALADATAAELASIQPLEYRQEYVSGVDGIDDDHRMIVERTNALIRDLRTGAPVARMEAQIRALAGDLRAHFEAEARLHGTSPYEGSVDVKTRNLRFLEELNCILVHPTAQSVALAVRHLYDWLVPHLMNLDARMAA